jgi:predicted metal-dependent phosphoesterase TrpH
MVLADFHVHSKHSDGSMTIPELVDFYGRRGFGCIAITDHICERNTVLGLAARYMNYTLTAQTFPVYLAEIEREAARALDQYGMIVLPGFELSKNALSNHRSAHILGIGISRFLGAEGEVTDLARAIRAQGGLAVAAHPVPTGKTELQTLHLWNRRDELEREFDAWEVASGAEIFAEVAHSRLPMIATSDLHHAKNINAWKTIVDAEKHPEAILAAVRARRVQFKFYEDHVTL